MAEECIGLHHAFITDRGGNRRISEVIDISQIRWNRVRDEVSEAQIIVQGSACSRQADVLAAIEPKRHELVIFRGDERVWEGPVSRVGWHSDWVEVAAKDVADYLFGRPLSQTWDNRYPNVTHVMTRLEEIVAYELTNPYTYRDDQGDPVMIPAWEAITPPANVLPYFTVHHSVNEVDTSALTTPFQMSVGEHLDNYARTGGIDYTTVGRAIHVWDVSRNLGQTRTLTEADFFGEVIITAYGADHASVAFAVANDGRYGGAGGVSTDWKFLQKTGAAGAILTIPPTGSTPRRSSIADTGGAAWNGYRYWLAYQRDAGATMRLAASKDGTTWVDVNGVDIDADPTGGVTASAGNWPALSFAYDERLWLFFIGTNGHLYRTRTEDGRDFTSQIDLYTPAGGVTLASPSLFFNPDAGTNGLWTLFAINTTANTLVYMTSTTNVLDATGQWGALSVAAIDGAPAVAAIEMRHIGGKWVGLLTTTGGDVYVIESKTELASGGFSRGATVAIPKVAATKHDTLGKATWLQNLDGSMEVWYTGFLSGAARLLRTQLTGPAPDIGTGDVYMEYYGPWTKIFTVYDEDETKPPTQADLNGQAARNLAGRSPVPLEVRVPDNSSIRLGPGLQMSDLVPGVRMPLLATLNSRQVSQDQKLHQLTVTETAAGETIQVTLVPATREDADTEDEEEED